MQNQQDFEENNRHTHTYKKNTWQKIIIKKPAIEKAIDKGYPGDHDHRQMPTTRITAKTKKKPTKMIKC